MRSHSLPSHSLHYLPPPTRTHLHLSRYQHCDDLTEMTADLDVPLSCPNATAKAAFARAVKRGTITWHAGPMNMQVRVLY